MKVRLVAYRPKVAGSTTEYTYQLDLQESPSISLNYQFADLKEPEKRKANFSQTFKLPFSQANDSFFETWFNVNTVSIVFDTKKKFNAVLYVGSVPQFDGVLQLKGVYLKAKYYEVTLMSNSADLFTAIGSKKLRDVFKNEDGTYSNELNHQYTYQSIAQSWDGSTTDFVNTSGVPLQDATSGVNKVMYPLSFTMPRAYFSATYTQYLNMSQANIDENYTVPITQFRPAIQLKTLLKLIIARAGFSYTSSFIDGAYFGKLFMTTCGQLGLPGPVEESTAGTIDGTTIVGNSTGDWGTFTLPAGSSNVCGQGTDWFRVPADTVTPIAGETVPVDQNNLWNEINDTFHKQSDNMVNANVSFIYSCLNFTPHNQFNMTLNDCMPPNTNDYLFEVEVRSSSGGQVYSYQPFWVPYGAQLGANSTTAAFHSMCSLDIDLVSVPTGEFCSFYVRARYLKIGSPGSDSVFTFGSAQCMTPWLGCTTDDYSFAGMYSQITVEWVGYNMNIINQNIDVPAGIDDKLTQKAFLKDLMERFNLIILADPDNASNLIIEPYDNYLASGGTIKNWTKKLDTDKEIIVRDTTSLQKQRIHFTDLEDNDLLNKSIREELPDYNVYGKIDIRETNNEYAKGEMTNKSIFSPYINEKIFQSNNDTQPTQLQNVAAHYEYTYKKTAQGYEDVLEPTKPKLFYYSGTATPLINSVNYYLHETDSGTGLITARAYNRYSTISPTTKSLNWNNQPPVCGDLEVFNYTPNSMVLQLSLYYLYWFNNLVSIYGDDARVMECHLDLNEVDIFSFKFNDQIFIKDTYWRILSISNYQVGSRASTKVSLLKMNESYDNSCTDCNLVTGSLNGSNTIGPFQLFCPDSDPSCTPDFTPPNYAGVFVSEICCECNGGTPWIQASNPNGTATYLCLANTGSLPIQLMTIFNNRTLFNAIQKSIYSGKLGGISNSLVIGNYTNKYGRPLVADFGNDLVIKHKTDSIAKRGMEGESHRIILVGTTIKGVSDSAYINGNPNEPRLRLPNNCNAMIRVKGISTVISTGNATYPISTTEGFAYYTGFKKAGGAHVQLGTSTGVQELSIREGVLPTMCTLSITIRNGCLNFELIDATSPVVDRMWQLTVDVDINILYQMEKDFIVPYAQFQDYRNILFQNGDYMLWN